MNAIRDVDARFAGENDSGCKTLGAILGLGYVKRLSECSVWVVRLLESHRYVVAQQIASATKRLVGRPLVEDALQIEWPTRQVHEVLSLQVMDQTIDVFGRTMLRKLPNVLFVERFKQEDVHSLLRLGRISGLYILASRFDTRFRERQKLLD